MSQGVPRGRELGEAARVLLGSPRRELGLEEACLSEWQPPALGEDGFAVLSHLVCGNLLPQP